MTREEAIYWIENLSGSWDGQYREARDMAIAALREQPRWISVGERLPEKSGRYLIAVETTGYVGTRYFYEICPEAFTMNQAFTHWMPLPHPPKEEV